MITLYVGRRGCGKTTTMVKDAYLYKLHGWKIFTNMNSLLFADEVLSVDEIITLLSTDTENYVLVLDEIQTLIDSRRSIRKRNVDFTYFIQQIRKRNIKMLASTQFSIRADKAFREHVDIEARPRFFEQYPVIVVTYTDMTFGDELFVDVEEYQRQIVFDPTQIYPLFDTKEKISPGITSVESKQQKTSVKTKA